MKAKEMAAILAGTCLTFTLVACGTGAELESASPSDTATTAAVVQPADNAATAAAAGETIADDSDGGHAIEADGMQESYAGVSVVKTGDSDSGDEADFYGENAAIFATNGATLNLADITVDTDGTHANAVFSYGEGTTVNIADSTITTSGNCSGGLMTTGGGTMNATNLTIATSGNSSAAIRSDRGGGTVTVEGGTYTTSGTGSPVIYSTADITVRDAYLESTASQGVVVEGKNSVALYDVDLVADNNTKNSDKSDWYQAVMIYQSMSGDAASGTSSFSMEGGSLTNANGDVLFVNNTACEIALSGVDIVNNGDGVFLRAAAAGWGSEGSNGGQVTLRASDQAIEGDLLVDEVSSLNLYLQDGSSLTGAVNPDGQAGEVYVELAGGSTWTLTGDSYITALTCDADAIDLNGFSLYVDGVAYEAGTASAGEAIEVVVAASADGGAAPDGMPGEPPSGMGAPGDGGEPPAKPEGDAAGAPGGEPPAKPGSNS